MNNVIQFRLDAYALSEVAEAWKCTVREIIQLAIDGKLRLSVRTKFGKLVEFDDEGEQIATNSSFPLSIGRYLFLDVEDLIEIDKNEWAEVSIFYGGPEDNGPIVYETSLIVKKEHLRLVNSERMKFESEQGAEEKPFSENERQTMLKLIIGMAIDAYGFDPSSNRNAATGENNGSIKAALDLKGVNIDADTIRKYLKEAKDLL